MALRETLMVWIIYWIGCNVTVIGSYMNVLEGIWIYYMQLRSTHAKCPHHYLLSLNIAYHPMLGADSRFWLANNREVYTRISRLTSSAWNIMRKERHWWRHNGDHDRRPLSLPLRCDWATLYIRWFRLDKKGIWDFKAAGTFQNLTHIVWAWDKFVTPCLLPWKREFIHT